MTCEFCSKSRMDVQTWDIRGVIKYNACVPCARFVDNLVLKEEERIRTVIETMIGEAEKRNELKGTQG